MLYKDSLCLSNLNTPLHMNTRKPSFKNESSLQEAYEDLGTFPSYPHLEFAPNNAYSTLNNPILAPELAFSNGYDSTTGFLSTPGVLSTPGLLFTPGFMSTSENMTTPGYVRTPGYAETPSYFTQQRTSSTFLSDNTPQKHLSFSAGIAPVDYFNVSSVPTRYFSLSAYSSTNCNQLEDTITTSTNHLLPKIEKKTRHTKPGKGLMKNEQPNAPFQASISPTLSTSSHSSMSLSTESPKVVNVSSTKPHACHYCHRSFSRKYDARRHIRIHTGDKPYTCLCCSKGFTRSDALRRHVQKEIDCYAYSRDCSISKKTKLNRC